MKKLFNSEMQQALHIDDVNRQGFRAKYADESDTDYSRAIYSHCRAHWNSIKPEIAKVYDKKIGGVPCRIYQPKPDTPNPIAVIFAHGGGWVVGNLESHDRICRKIAGDAGVDVIAVDYSLSPESTHPTPILEVFAVFKAIQVQYEQVILAGDSAGAHLSLAVSHHCQKTSTKQPNALILIYGAFGLVDSPSMRQFGLDDYYGLTTKDMTKYVNAYFGKETTAENILQDEYFNLLANDLSQTPPCLIIASQVDSLRDDSRALHEMLNIADVPNIYLEYEGVMHGFLHYSSVLERARHALAQICAFINQKLLGDNADTMLGLVENAKAQITNIDVSGAIELIQSGEYQIIDLRDIRELWRDGTIPGSFHAPRCMLEFWVDPKSPYYKPQFARDKKYLLFCAGGWRSALAAKTMKDMGFNDVAHIIGGFGAYQKSGATIQPVAQPVPKDT